MEKKANGIVPWILKVPKTGIVDLVFCFAAWKTEAQETVAQAHACN